MFISYTRHNKASEKYHEIKLCVCVGGGARGAYLARGLVVLIVDGTTNVICNSVKSMQHIDYTKCVQSVHCRQTKTV